MRKIIYSLVFIFILVAALTSYGDTVYPSGYNLMSSYSINADEIAVDDTLIITRELTNNESDNITGLYLGENLPAEFDLVGYEVTINDLPITGYEFNQLDDLELPGNISYSWLFDRPGDASLSTQLSPGDRLTLKIMVVCPTIGDYSLPLHTAVFKNGNQGFFATSDVVSLKVVLSLDVDDESDHLLPEDYLISSAYPNPFNATVSIRFEGSNLRSKEAELEIFNLLGQRVYDERFIVKSNQFTVNWNIDNDQATGLYYYRLTADQKTTGGKIVLLK